MQTLCNRFYKVVVEKVFSSDANDCVPLISEPVDDPMFLVSNVCNRQIINGMEQRLLVRGLNVFKDRHC
jgi:hypothetical protein